MGCSPQRQKSKEDQRLCLSTAIRNPFMRFQLENGTGTVGSPFPVLLPMFLFLFSINPSRKLCFT